MLWDELVDDDELQGREFLRDFARRRPRWGWRRAASEARRAAQRGFPAFVRFDSGPGFIAHAVAESCRFNHVATMFIDPGLPWQNAWIESFNGRLRDELLDSWPFDRLVEARDHRGLAHRRQRAPTAPLPTTTSAPPSSPEAGPSTNQKPQSNRTTLRVPLTPPIAETAPNPRRAHG